MRLLSYASACLIAGIRVSLAHTEVHIVDEILPAAAGVGRQIYPSLPLQTSHFEHASKFIHHLDPLQYASMPAPLSARHNDEHASLQSRICKRHGTWGSSHPRFRLLDALWGYLSYEDRNKAELDRWRDLYKNVGKKQSEVWWNLFVERDWRDVVNDC